MCRLFGILGGAATPAEPWLALTDRSLLAQSDTSPKNVQKDGWGIGWYETTRTPHVEKGVGGAFEASEKPHYLASSRRAHGPVVIAHLRDASNPMNLPRQRLLGLENCQPFTYESFLFAHNGSIPLPRETRHLLGKFEGRIRGVNDSEVLFGLFARHVDQVGDPLSAYAQTVNDLVSVWRANGSPEGGPYSGLNVVFSRGPNELWAFCLWLGEHGSRFFDPSRPYYEMAYAADAKQVVVGSEPFDSREMGWRPIPNGTYLYAHAAHGLVAMRSGPIPLVIPPPPSPGS